MDSATQFVDGLIVKKPSDKSPEWIICNLSMKREELINWLAAQPGEWVNVQVKESRKGTYYAQVDSWKPQEKKQEDEFPVEYDGSVDAGEMPDII